MYYRSLQSAPQAPAPKKCPWPRPLCELVSDHDTGRPRVVERSPLGWMVFAVMFVVHLPSSHFGLFINEKRLA
jgi:hypothetical protein